MIYGLLLAAGASTRMGQPKQLLDWYGRPLVRHMAETALASRLAGLVVVLGAAGAEVGAALDGLAGPVKLVMCPGYAEGQAASLRCGLSSLPAEVTAVVVLLVDQPLVRPVLLDHLVQAFLDDQTAPAVVPYYQGRRGNPVLLSAALLPQLSRLTGDTGAREILQAYAERIRRLEVNDPAVVADADTPEAYLRQLQEALEGQGET